jgi:signal transduction histidine kinase
MAEVMNCLLELGDSAQQALKEMRLLVYELRPPVLKRDGLVGALQHRLDAVEGRAGITAQLLTNQMVPLPVRLEQDLYHIALEALNNSLKHAQASSVTISVETGQHYTRLEVADNGCGFNPDQAVDSGGLGLISMRQRAERIGGLLNIQAQAGQGTTIRVRVENLL